MLPDLQVTDTCVFSVVVCIMWSIRVCGVCVSCGVQLYVCVCVRVWGRGCVKRPLHCRWL